MCFRLSTSSYFGAALTRKRAFAKFLIYYIIYRHYGCSEITYFPRNSLSMCLSVAILVKESTKKEGTKNLSNQIIRETLAHATPIFWLFLTQANWWKLLFLAWCTNLITWKPCPFNINNRKEFFSMLTSSFYDLSFTLKTPWPHPFPISSRDKVAKGRD